MQDADEFNAAGHGPVEQNVVADGVLAKIRGDDTFRADQGDFLRAVRELFYLDVYLILIMFRS